MDITFNRLLTWLVSFAPVSKCQYTYYLDINGDVLDFLEPGTLYISLGELNGSGDDRWTPYNQIDVTSQNYECFAINSDRDIGTYDDIDLVKWAWTGPQKLDIDAFRMGSDSTCSTWGATHSGFVTDCGSRGVTTYDGCCVVNASLAGNSKSVYWREPCDGLAGSPTNSPTKAPTAPTKSPTDKPTNKPTDRPTGSPTIKPTNKPTDNPTDKPTDYPTDKPSNNPTNRPTASPTDKPTISPTSYPTDKPTINPTNIPSNKPSGSPTSRPTNEPSISPTGDPSKYPTMLPSDKPTNFGLGTLLTTGDTSNASTQSPTDNTDSVVIISLVAIKLQQKIKEMQ